MLHWGAPLGEVSEADAAELAKGLSRQSPTGTLDAAWQVSLSPAEGDGWSGRPGMQLRRGGVLHHARWVETDRIATADALEVRARDAASGLVLTIRVAIEAGGVVWVEQRLRHDGETETAHVEVEWLESALPVPTTTDSLTTFDGRWTREKRPVTTGMPSGSTVRQSRRGRPGHDAPTVAIASERPPLWGSGRLWAAHAAWSSDVTYRVDRVTDAVTLIGAGELLRPGELVLAPGQEYARAAGRVRVQPGGARRPRRADPHVDARAGTASVVPTPSGPEHVGGGLLRP